MASESPEDRDLPVRCLKNLGAASAKWLRDAGIHTKADLQKPGPVAAYRLVRQQQPRATLNLLWAIKAGLMDVDWRELSSETKEQLRREAEDEQW